MKRASMGFLPLDSQFSCPIKCFNKNSPYISVAKVGRSVKFVTGTYQMPPISFPSPIKVKFLHGCAIACKCRPVASTCSLALTLPVHSCRSEELGDLLISALTECCGFEKVEVIFQQLGTVHVIQYSIHYTLCMDTF